MRSIITIVVLALLAGCTTLTEAQKEERAYERQEVAEAMAECRWRGKYVIQVQEPARHMHDFRCVTQREFNRYLANMKHRR